MSAPLVPPGAPAPQRRPPTFRRLTAVHQVWWLLSLVFVAPAALALVSGALHGAPLWSTEAAVNGALIVAGVALFWWRASRLRRAFVRGREVLGRVTHFERFAGDGKVSTGPARPPWDMLAAAIDRPMLLRPSFQLVILYPAEGGERYETYLLDDQAVGRLRPVVGDNIALIVDPDLPQPLLRDAYLDD